MSALYVVKTARFGEILRQDDSIRAARAWARTAFPREPILVKRWFATRSICAGCDSRPCCCKALR